jgi:hypothetical protein
MSLFFRCRFYLISSRLPPGNPRLGMTIKQEYPFVRVRCNPGIHPPLFESQNKNFATDFKQFLDTIRLLNPKSHQDVILACHHYARGVREVGVDPEMVFIRLVSSIEALSKNLKLTHNDDILEEQKVSGLIEESHLTREQKGELKNVFNVRKSRKKFVRFIEQNCGGFFKGGNFKAKHLKVKRADLPAVLDVIYTARSKYLHAGEPMFLSRAIKGGEKWDTDPTAGMIADNRSFAATQKLPYGFFFEGLVRHCLLSYIDSNLVLLTGGSMSELVFAFGSNMCSGRFRDYKVSPEGPGRAAVLSGYCLAFNKKSTKDMSGKANVTAKEASEVWGVLYTVSGTDKTKLDEGEGGYRPVKMSVRLQDNSAAEAWVYVAKKPDSDSLRPFTSY